MKTLLVRPTLAALRWLSHAANASLASLFLLCLIPSPAAAGPTNDDFAMRAMLSGSPVQLLGSLVGATRETNEPVHAVYGDRGSAWWTWTAPADGVVEISSLPDRPAYALAQVVAVYQGDSLGSLQEVTGETGWGPAFFLAAAGQIYQIAVSDVQDDREIAYQLVLYDSPSNDNFAARLPLAPGATNHACNFFATMEPGEPGGASANKTLWWTWTAPAHGLVSFSKAELTLLQLFTGEAVDQLAPWPSTNSFGLPGEEVFPGDVLQVRVDEGLLPYEPSRGHVEFSMTFSPVPTNDQFAGRMELTGLPVEVAGDNRLASAEPGEPWHMQQPPMKTLWYQWTATNSARVGLLLDADWATPVISVYTGTSLSNLVPIAGGRYYPAPLMFTARAGRTYSIAVGTTWSAGPFRLALVGPPPNDDFLSAALLAGWKTATNSYTTCATMESGEARVTRFDSRQSVWWQWQAPFSGLAQLNVRAHYPIPLQVYTGSALGRLRPVSFQSYTASWYGNTASFFAAAGATYHIRASGVRYVQDRQLVLSNGRLDLDLAMATLSVQSASGDTSFVVPNPVPVQAAPLPDFAAPSCLTFSAARYGYQPVQATVCGPPWQFAFTNLSPGIHEVSVSGTNAAGEWQFSAPMTIRVRPVNDDFAGRLAVGDLPAMLQDSLAGATIEPAEPALAGARKNGSVWYTWHSPSNSLVRLTVYDGTLGIFTGSSFSTLHPVGKYSKGAYSFRVGSNVTYQFQCSAPANAESPAHYAAFLARPQPNDHFAHRLTLTGTNVTFLADNSAATAQPGEPGSYRPSLWWTWTAPGDGTLILSRSNAAATTCFGVYLGSTLKTLNPVYSLWDWNASPVLLQVSNAATYQLAIYTPSVFEAGPVPLNLRFVPRSTNDNFASRIRLDDRTLTFHGANYAATTEPNEPARIISSEPRSALVQATLWWEWTANTDGVAVIDVAPGDFHPFVEMFEGAGLGALTSLDTGIAWPTVSSSYHFSVQAGHTYFISVGGCLTSRGEFTCVLRPPCPPPNDAFANALPVTGTNGTLAGSLFNATREPGEPAPFGQQIYPTVWYRWTAPADGVGCLGSSGMYAASVYTGTAVDALTPVYQQDFGYYPPRFNASAGVTYAIAITCSWPSDFSIPFWLEPNP